MYLYHVLVEQWDEFRCRKLDYIDPVSWKGIAIRFERSFPFDRKRLQHRYVFHPSRIEHLRCSQCQPFIFQNTFIEALNTLL